MKIKKLKKNRNTTQGLALRLRPIFEDFHQLIVEKDNEYPEHKHINYELIVVDKGPYTCTLNKEELQIKNGEFLIIKPGDVHQDHFKKGQKHYVLHFQIAANEHNSHIRFQLFSPDIKAFQQIGIERLPKPTSFFKDLQLELEKGDVFSTYAQDSMLETFFWQLTRKLPQATLSNQFHQLSKQMEFHTRLLSLFQSTYQKNLGLKEIANSLAISERTLAYKCKEFLGQSPALAFSTFRINKAAELLTSSDLTIQEISNQMGYENPFHFSRIFKKIMKLPPRSYRKSFR